MKKLTTMMLLSAGMLSLISCKKEVVGEGPAVTQERPITSFSAIDLRMAGDVYYKQDATLKLEIIAQQNILNMLETYVSDNKLVIKFNGASDYQYSEQIRINISAKSVTAKTSGSGSIKVKAADHLDATVEGSGSIYFTGYPSVSSHIYGTGHLIHF